MALFYRYYFLNREGQEVIFYAESKKEARKDYKEWHIEYYKLPSDTKVENPKLIRRERW